MYVFNCVRIVCPYVMYFILYVYFSFFLLLFISVCITNVCMCFMYLGMFRIYVVFSVVLPFCTYACYVVLSLCVSICMSVSLYLYYVFVIRARFRSSFFICIYVMYVFLYVCLCVMCICSYVFLLSYVCISVCLY